MHRLVVLVTKLRRLRCVGRLSTGVDAAYDGRAMDVMTRPFDVALSSCALAR